VQGPAVRAVGDAGSPVAVGVWTARRRVIAASAVGRSGGAAAREMRARDWDRVAADYADVIVSPLAAGLPPPLARALAAVPDAAQKTVADLGCGVGTLLPALAARFGRVLAVDFSPAMLARARAACRARHVSVHRADLAALRPLHGRVDVAVTVNAVLTPDPDRLDRAFAELRAVLRPDGLLLGVFPAMEAVLYQGLLIHERERPGRTPARARARTSAILERAKYDFVHGTYREDATTQKFFYAFELEYRLRRAGFRRPRLGRVVYPWDEVGGFERFPGEPPMWDWFVRARPA
jgi:SAM-dependent methyltransferase